MSHYPKAKASTADTHMVENMPPVLENYNLFSSDVTLREAVVREGGDWALENLMEHGRLCGSDEFPRAQPLVALET